MKTKIIIIISAAICIFSSPAFSFTDQTTTERILKENQHFIDFINICMTNFGENRENDYFKVFELHFNADVAYLQADYKRAYKRIYSSQTDLDKLYAHMLKNIYLEDSKDILDNLAPDIIRSKNARARLYLTLGYRDRTVSWTHYSVGIASNPKLHSYRLYKFVEAIKMARRAKRYGFLALFESQSTDTKRKIYNNLLKNENQSGLKFFTRFADLDDNGYIDEMAKNYEEHITAVKKNGGEENPDMESFEKKLDRRVRFRHEKKTARLLFSFEFDRAEDIIRKYITDFNFKLISATLKHLSSQNESKAGTSGKKINYPKYSIHLLDNYSRLKGKSIINEFLSRVRVEDSVEADIEKREDEKNNLPEEKKSEKNKTLDSNAVEKNNLEQDKKENSK